MKKKNLFLWSVMVMMFFLFSCNSEEESVSDNWDPVISLSQEELVSILFDNPEELEESEAINLVSNFLEALNAEKTTRSSKNVSLKVSDKFYYADRDTNQIDTKSSFISKITLPIYEVSITDAGFTGVAYVSADERYPEVLVYTPKASGDDEAFIESGAVFLTEWAKASALDEILKVEQIRENYRTATVAKISQELGIPESEVIYDNIKDRLSVNGEPVTRATPVPGPPTQLVTSRGPFVPVQWYQDSPYNRDLPVPLPTASQSNVYTGCATTAIAQLLTACRPTLTIEGTRIDWDILTDTPEATIFDSSTKLDMLGKLFKWIYEELEARPIYDSNGNHTGTSVFTSMSDQFMRTYLNGGNLIDYDPDVLLSSMNAYKPSWISGQNHAFIIDGYIICQKASRAFEIETRADIVKMYDMYWHINLGWGGDYDGYYKLKPDTHVDIEAGSRTYNTQYLQIKANLSKKN